MAGTAQSERDVDSLVPAISVYECHPFRDISATIPVLGDQYGY